jgi:CheY-like chemotaxis protein
VSAFARARDQGRPFRAVILDLTVPGGVGGVATLAALKAIDPEVRAAASSGYAEDDSPGGLRGHGFAAVLVKPYSVEELASVVARLVDG